MPRRRQTQLLNQIGLQNIMNEEEISSNDLEIIGAGFETLASLFTFLALVKAKEEGTNPLKGTESSRKKAPDNV
ncbi:hypothetical protein [Paenibacillus motobuensis]